MATDQGEKIRLILAFVGRPIKQAVARVRVVAGRDAVGPEAQCVLAEWRELDFTIAQQVGVGGASGRVLVQKILKMSQE